MSLLLFQSKWTGDFLLPAFKSVISHIAMPGMELPSPEEVFANALSSTTNLTHSVQDLTHSEIGLFPIV